MRFIFKHCLLILFLTSFFSGKSMAGEISLTNITSKDNLVSLLKKRYSCRRFTDKNLSRDDVSLLIWAASGRIQESRFGVRKTVPSAGALYPLEIYVLIGEDAVEGISAGLYRYNDKKHILQLIYARDSRKELQAACLGQDFIGRAPLSLIVAAVFGRTTQRYGERGLHYVYMEAGHSCQNIYLMAIHLGLGTVEIGAFYDQKVKDLLAAVDIDPIAVMPIGYCSE
jgi:SagB-type dehydrogenase family enzyme